MFHITPPALNELLGASARSPGAGALRIAAREGDDGSIEVGMGFDDEREHDQRLAFGPLTVLLGARSQALLDQAVLDFVEIEPGRHEFVFAPAPATAACAPTPACGGGGCSRCGG